MTARSREDADLLAASSQLFRRRDRTWIHPIHRPEFLFLRNFQPRARIAVVVHVFYLDLWPEIWSAICNIDEPFDVFVSLVTGTTDSLAAHIRKNCPRAHILFVDNHGRDILPLMLILQTRVLFKYELICKLHTKRSFWHENGDAWRRDLIAGVLGSPEVVRSILHAFRSDVNLGIVVAEGQLYTGRELWVGNRRHLMRLFSHFGMDDSEFEKAFAGGSVFWIRPSLLRAIYDLSLNFDDFEPEPLAADGGLAHAIERLISLICYDAGMTIKETGAIFSQMTSAKPDSAASRGISGRRPTGMP